jgi:hypothetical protein
MFTLISPPPKKKEKERKEGKKKKGAREVVSIISGTSAPIYTVVIAARCNGRI